MILVKFIKNHTPYLAGETAGFSDAHTKRLEKLGVAVRVGSPAADKSMVPNRDYVTKPGSGSVTKIPEDWRGLHHFQRIKLAESVVGRKVGKAAEADAILNKATAEE